MDKKSRNRYNCYTCEAGHKTFTHDKDDGTTPFMMACPNHRCNLMAQSSFYAVNQVEAMMNVSFEWYSPTDEQINMTVEESVNRARGDQNMSKADFDKLLEITAMNINDHVEKGGLLLRPIKKDS